MSTCRLTCERVKRQVFLYPQTVTLPVPGKPQQPGGPDDAAARLLKEKIAGSRIVQIKAGEDPDVKNDAWILDTPIYLATHKNMSDEVVYQVLKVCLQNQQELVSIHPVFKGWTLKGSVSADAAIPYHPGAIRYYKEMGLWSDAMDAAQKKLLAR